MTDHSLTLGTLLLTGGVPNDDYDYAFDVLADGATFGVAAGVQEVVRSLLADGDIVRTPRSGNREVSFRVQITGPTLGALAHGEAALRRELGRANSLTWQAPDVLSVPTVFDVVDSEMAQSFNDLDELRRERVFVVTLACAPWVRPEEMVTVEALPEPGSLVEATINTADTTTGWTAFVNATAVTVTDEGDYVQATSSMPAPIGWRLWTLQLVLEFAGEAMSSTPYLRVETSGSGGSEVFTVLVDGAWVSVVPTLSQATGDVVAHFLDVDSLGSSVAGIKVARNSFGPATMTVGVHDVSRTNTLTQISPRQITRVIEVGGTERTPASLQVIPGAAEPLGVTFVHTSPASTSGDSPALRQYRYSGNTVTTDSALLSGAREPVNATPIIAHVPVASLPEDGYSLVAFMRSSVTGTFSFDWQARTIVAGSYYLAGTSGSAQARFFDVGAWTLVPLGILTLPPARAAVGSAVQFDLTRTVVGAEVIDLDEWWIFRMGDDCALTIVQSTVSSFLWLDSPDTTSPVPRVWIGGNSDRSDQHHPGADGLICQGNHILHPEGTRAFVASTGITEPQLSATYYPRWHSNVAAE